jgi:hypothetical protein
MKVLPNPVRTDDTATFSEMKLITEAYGVDLLKQVFDQDTWLTFLFVEARRFSDLSHSDALITLLPYLDEIDAWAGIEALHDLIQQGKIEFLGQVSLGANCARVYFLCFPDDLTELSQKQLVASLPRLKVNGRKMIGELSAQLFQKFDQSTVVPSLRFREEPSPHSAANTCLTRRNSSWESPN